MGAHQDRRQFWRAHFERCQELGMTLKSYAEQEGLTVSVFYGWSKRFKREQANQIEVQQGTDCGISTGRVPAKLSQWFGAGVGW